MPGGNGTGPAGAGPMTGRCMGYCPGNNVPAFANSSFNRGFGMGFARGQGRGFGRGFGWVANNTAAPVRPAFNATDFDLRQETQALKQQAEYLKQTLDGINQRIEQLEK